MITVYDALKNKILEILKDTPVSVYNTQTFTALNANAYELVEEREINLGGKKSNSRIIGVTNMIMAGNAVAATVTNFSFDLLESPQQLSERIHETWQGILKELRDEGIIRFKKAPPKRPALKLIQGGKTD